MTSLSIAVQNEPPQSNHDEAHWQASWVFESRSPTAVSQIPKTKEHFQGDRPDVAVKAMVREGNQNSQDAKDPEKSGPVRISIKRTHLKRDYFWSHLMNGLEPHLQAAYAHSRKYGGSIFETIDRNSDVPCLLVEDYNTTGLLGGIDPLSWEDPENEHTNFGNFFWRNGGSSKAGGHGGRHGIGKSTFTELSDLRAIIGVTRRDQAPHLVAYGQASFFPHRLPKDSRLFDAYGVFGDRKGDACYPITGDRAAHIADGIGFDRREKNGLSILIPFVKAEATKEAILYNFVMQCHHQICEGMLVANVEGTTIDTSTIVGLCRQMPELACLVPMIEMNLASAAGEVTVFKAAMIEKGSSSISIEAFSESDLIAMQALWADGQTFGVDFNVPVYQRTNPVGETGLGRIIIRRHEEKATAREAFSRGKVTVSATPAKGNYTAFFMTPESDILSRFLGDSENVAHTEWATSRVEKSYRKASETMSRVKNCLRDLYSVLSGIDQDKTIKHAFTDLLSVPKKADPESSRPKVEDLRPDDGLPDIPAPVKKAYILVRLSDGGFAVERTDTPGNFGCRLTAVYVTPGRKPKWNRADFDLGASDSEIDIIAKGPVEMSPPRDNEIVIDYAPPGSRLKVCGFDTNRDLQVSLTIFEVKQ